MINAMLWIENGEGAALAHRVTIAGKPFFQPIEGRRQRAVKIRGDCLDRYVPMTELTAAAPLSPAEEAEYRRLDRELAGTIGDARKLKRFNALRLRSLLFPGGE